MRLENLGPDLIAHNGKVITVDSGFTISDALAVKDGQFIGVGGGTAMLEQADDHTRIIDLGGRTVTPGLIDGHAHLDREGLKDVYPSLAGARSINDVLARIEALVAEAEPGDWVVTMPLGDPPSYWDVPEIFAENRFPTRQDLDSVSPDNPVYIRPIWGFWRHSIPLVSVANSLALEVAGITRETPDPCKTVEIERDKAGEPTGVFIEHSYMPMVEMSLLKACGGFTHADRVAALDRSITAYLAAGTTSVFEEHGVAAEVIRVYKERHEAGRMNIRANLVFSPSWDTIGDAPMGPLLESWSAWLAGTGMGDDYLRIHGLYSQIATEWGPGSWVENELRCQSHPYTGWAGFNFDATLPHERLVESLTSQMLEYLEEVERIEPISDRRWVLGHIGVLSPEETSRIRDLGLVTSTHTNRNIYRTGAELLAKVGPGRAVDISPLARMRDAGIRFALATDNVPVSLFHPVWQVITRIVRDTGEPIAPEQGISRQDAIRAATIDGAYLTMEEDIKGSIEVGKLADFAVLSADPLSVAEFEIKDIDADMTVVGGEVVYERSAP
jgi:hypothetical protein